MSLNNRKTIGEIRRCKNGGNSGEGGRDIYPKGITQRVKDRRCRSGAQGARNTGKAEVAYKKAQRVCQNELNGKRVG